MAARSARGRVDAIIVNWNGRRYLPHCVASLQRDDACGRIIVVDNASTDGSVAWLRQHYPDITVVETGANIGYAAGANAGLRAGDAEYAIVLNPDVALADDHLSLLVARLDEDRTIGVAQGKLYRVHPDDFVVGRFDSGGELDSAGHLIKRTRMVVDRGQGEADGPQYSVEASVFSACGAAMFLRRTLLEEVAVDGEYFDESFFAYKEDIDLCWRARLLGWDVRYVPVATAHHARGWPGTRLPDRHSVGVGTRRHSWKNHYLMLLKNDRFTDFVRALPHVLAWELGRQGYALLRDRALYASYRDLLRLLPDTLRRRRALHGRAARAAHLHDWFGSDVRPVARGASAVTAVAHVEVQA
jgi:GT2 family glycosyltransferase